MPGLALTLAWRLRALALTLAPPAWSTKRWSTNHPCRAGPLAKRLQHLSSHRRLARNGRSRACARIVTQVGRGSKRTLSGTVPTTRTRTAGSSFVSVPQAKTPRLHVHAANLLPSIAPSTWTKRQVCTTTSVALVSSSRSPACAGPSSSAAERACSFLKQ